MSYVDGFVLVVPKRKLAIYKSMARKAGKVWRDHGALDYRECVGDDLNVKMGVSFTKLAKTKPSETVVFSYIVYKSRAHRDKVNAKVMADPRMQEPPKDIPFDMKRMAYVLKPGENAPPPGVQRAFDKAREIRQMILEVIRPGVTAGDALALCPAVAVVHQVNARAGAVVLASAVDGR